MSLIIYVSGFGTESKNNYQTTSTAGAIASGVGAVFSNKHNVCSMLEDLFPESDVYHYSDYPPKDSPSDIKDKSFFKYINQKDAITEYASKLEGFISSKGRLEEAIVIGHSLGAALVIEFLKNIRMRKRIRTAILLGAAFQSNWGKQNFHDLLYSVTHSILNLHNPRDEILRKYYKEYEGVDAIGLVGMPIQSNDFINNIEYGTSSCERAQAIIAQEEYKRRKLKDTGLSDLTSGLLIAASAFISKNHAIGATAGISAYQKYTKLKEEFKQDRESHSAINYMSDLVEWLKAVPLYI